MTLFKKNKLSITKLQTEQVIDKLKIDWYDKSGKKQKVVKPTQPEVKVSAFPVNQPVKQSANHGY
jgi:hypothetical protein